MCCEKNFFKFRFGIKLHPNIEDFPNYLTFEGIEI